MAKQGPVLVEKVELLEGETVFDYIDKIYNALWRSRTSISMSLSMVAVYNDHVVARDGETGRFYKMEIKREGDLITLEGLQEVKMEFVPVQTEKDEGGYTPRYVTPNIWRSII